MENIQLYYLKVLDVIKMKSEDRDSEVLTIPLRRLTLYGYSPGSYDGGALKLGGVPEDELIFILDKLVHEEKVIEIPKIIRQMGTFVHLKGQPEEGSILFSQNYVLQNSDEIICRIISPAFENLYKNLVHRLSQKSHDEQNNNQIFISVQKGIYRVRDGNEFCYPIKKGGYKLLELLCKSLKNGHPNSFLSEQLHKDSSYITKTIERINKLCIKKLKITGDLIIKAREGYRLNTDKFEFHIGI